MPPAGTRPRRVSTLRTQQLATLLYIYYIFIFLLNVLYTCTHKPANPCKYWLCAETEGADSSVLTLSHVLGLSRGMVKRRFRRLEELPRKAVKGRQIRRRRQGAHRRSAARMGKAQRVAPKPHGGLPIRAPYRPSPTRGSPRLANCTRIWWVRPVSSRMATRLLPLLRGQDAIEKPRLLDAPALPCDHIGLVPPLIVVEKVN